MRWFLACLALAGCGADPLLLGLQSDAGPLDDAGASQDGDGRDGGATMDAGGEERSDDAGASLDGALPDSGSVFDDAGPRGDGGEPDASVPDASRSETDAGAPPPQCTVENEVADCLLGGTDLHACNPETGRCVECRPAGPTGQCTSSIYLPSCSLETNTCISRGNACIEICAFLAPTATCTGNVLQGSTELYERECGYWLNLEPGSL